MQVLSIVVVTKISCVSHSFNQVFDSFRLFDVGFHVSLLLDYLHSRLYAFILVDMDSMSILGFPDFGFKMDGLFLHFSSYKRYWLFDLLIHLDNLICISYFSGFVCCYSLSDLLIAVTLSLRFSHSMQCSTSLWFLSPTCPGLLHTDWSWSHQVYLRRTCGALAWDDICRYSVTFAHRGSHCIVASRVLLHYQYKCDWLFVSLVFHYL